jgi:glycosyltransferase involved in cell wall biosynthesis
MSRADVALISPYPSSSAGRSLSSGVAAYTRSLAQALVDAGASVTVIAAEEGGSRPIELDGEVRVERCFRPGSGALVAAGRAARASGASVVHLQHELFLYGGVSATPGLLAVLRPTSESRPVTVVTMHQVVDPAAVDRSFVRLHRIRVPVLAARAGISAIQRTIQAMADAVIVHEQSFQRVISRASAVPHGLSIVGPPERAQARARLGLDDAFTVLCFGFIAPYKGLELACEAAELARRAGAPVRFIVAGGEHPRLVGRDAYAGALRARFSSTAHFTGYVPESDVSDWFAAADLALFLYPQPHASSGALALALAHGTPFLVSPALAELIGASGPLVAASSAPELAAQLGRLATSRKARHQLGSAGAELAAGRTWPAVASRHLALYEEVLNANRAPRWRLRAAEP